MEREKGEKSTVLLSLPGKLGPKIAERVFKACLCRSSVGFLCIIPLMPMCICIQESASCVCFCVQSVGLNSLYKVIYSIKL